MTSLETLLVMGTAVILLLVAAIWFIIWLKGDEIRRKLKEL